MIPEPKIGWHACKGSRNEYYGKREAYCLRVSKDRLSDHYYAHKKVGEGIN